MSWQDFYRQRINSSYQEYFETRYQRFLLEILRDFPKGIIDEGCGIGSITKFLLKHNVKCLGYDIDLQMVEMAKANQKLLDRGKYQFWVGNILDPKYMPEDTFTFVSHGVLEHFTDQQILKIMSRYNGRRNVHYVPSDKYVEPSFGDERLLSKEYWEQLLPTHQVIEFNEGFDLILSSR